MTGRTARVVIFGATSAIAQATARRFAMEGAAFFLVARNDARLRAVADDLMIRGATGVQTSIADLDDRTVHPRLLAEIRTAFGGIDIALLAWGFLPDQDSGKDDPESFARSVTTNMLAPAALVTLLVPMMLPARDGVIAVITSVAGDRGRRKNYLYGAAKGGLQLFLQGLRHRCHGSGLTILDIRPGFVATPMTAHMPTGALFAKPATAGACIHQAIKAKKDVAYVPGFWRPVMWVIRSIPERIFGRFNI